MGKRPRHGDMNFGTSSGLLTWTFVLVMYLMILFQILGDLFPRQRAERLVEGVCVIALIIFPCLTTSIYFDRAVPEWRAPKGMR
jgi:hypothetical protein